MPQIALKLVFRLMRQGQKYVAVSENIPLPLPPGTTEPTGLDLCGFQPPEEGFGPLFYKRYSVDFSESNLDAASLMHDIQANPDRFIPHSLARYEKTKGKVGVMEVGDEYFIRMTGPWTGPVRVIATTPVSFTFVTLKGHMEAGEIHVELQMTRSGLRFTIQSWTRSRDEGVDLAYHKKLKLAQLVQAEMWTSFSEKVIRYAKGRQQNSVKIETQKLPFSKIPSELLERKNLAQIHA